jgi:hypothetical protein
MRADGAKRIEKAVDRLASGLFAGAAACAIYNWLIGSLADPVLDATAGGVACLAYFVSIRALAAVGPEVARLPVPIFDLRSVEPLDLEELLLTDRHEPLSEIRSEPLVLDDILAEIGPESRVIRLFDPAAMQTPGQLNARIARHLERDVPPAPSQDASQALLDALAELRRSMR